MINNYTYDINRSLPRSAKDVVVGTKGAAKDVNYKIIGDPYKKFKKISYSNRLSIHEINMSLEHHFKVTIEGLSDANGNMALLGDKSNNYGSFLPVESISLTPVSVSSIGLDIGIFSGLPILNKRKMGNLKIVLLDDETNTYSDTVIDWFQSTTSGGFVKTLSEMLREVHYIEYSPQGVATKHYQFWVIPDGDISLNRGYNSNALKKIEFTTLIIGDIINVGDRSRTAYEEKEVYGNITTNTNTNDKVTRYMISKNGKVYNGQYYLDKEVAEREAKKLNLSSDNYTTLNSTRVNNYEVLEVEIPSSQVQQ